jgi:dipeptidyl aminopeptidase/acylaminoacyl peptidase
MAPEARDPLTGRWPGPAAPATAALADAPGPVGGPAAVHACWYPSADPAGTRAAFISDRGGVPQLWCGSLDGPRARLLDPGPDPVTEVSWSPDGRWIAYVTAPGGGERARVLVVRPDGTGRRALGGAEPGTSATLGCWARDGSALAVTVAEAVPPGARVAQEDTPGDLAPAEGHGIPSDAASDVLSAYWIDPDGERAPRLLASERGAACLRVCDSTADGRLVLLRRGPRGRREAVVVRPGEPEACWRSPVADGDPWIGRFSPAGDRLWLRVDAGREFAALVAAYLTPYGRCLRHEVAAERAGADLELLAVSDDGRQALLAWNVSGRTALQTAAFDEPPLAGDGRGPVTADVPLPHEVVTRVAPVRSGGALLAVSGARRRPGIWLLPAAGSPVRTGWSSSGDALAATAGRPVTPRLERPKARDGLTLSGWYYRAPGRAQGRPAPCVIHLHGGPEDQERPVFDPLYHELLGRGLDVFAPDVRGSSGSGRSYREADLGAGRFAAISDVADCAAHIADLGLADPGRLAVMGRSYGGYLTLASLMWHPELFRTGISVCGMSDFATFFAETEPWIAESAAAKYGHPVHDRDLLHALSPMSRIDALRAPLLTVHGEHDTNVPLGESVRIVRAARARGVPAELLLLHDEGHEFLRRPNRRLFRRTAADWMEHWLLRP